MSCERVEHGRNGRDPKLVPDTFGPHTNPDLVGEVGGLAHELEYPLIGSQLERRLR